MKTRLIVFQTMMITAVAGCHRQPAHPPAGAALAVPRTNDERTLYVLGTLMADRVNDFNLTPQEAEIVAHGFVDAAARQHRLAEGDDYGPRIRELQRTRSVQHAQALRAEGDRFAAHAATEAGAQRLQSGAIYRETAAGTGAQPAATDDVTVNYRGTLIDGTEFDSTYSRHRPATLTLGQVIPCWTEALQRMHVGGRAHLVCPPDTAYGDRAQRNIPSGSTLIFDVELVGAGPRQAPNAASAPPAMPPFPGLFPGAPRTAAPSGLGSSTSNSIQAGSPGEPNNRLAPMTTNAGAPVAH